LRRKGKHGDEIGRTNEIESRILPDLRENDEIKRENVFLQEQEPQFLGNE